MNFSGLKNLIEENDDIVEFCDGVDHSEIMNLENAIGLSLPVSYKWWLENYNGGEIGGEEIFSIYKGQNGAFSSGDLLTEYRQSKLPKERIPILHSDIDGVFSLDTSNRSSLGECVVVAEGISKVYADNFLEFLKKRIELYLE